MIDLGLFTCFFSFEQSPNLQYVEIAQSIRDDVLRLTVMMRMVTGTCVAQGIVRHGRDFAQIITQKHKQCH